LERIKMKTFSFLREMNMKWLPWGVQRRNYLRMGVKDAGRRPIFIRREAYADISFYRRGRSDDGI